MAINSKKMKPIIILAILILIVTSGFSQPPKELHRVRLMEGDNYGNPYTMFIKEPGFNLEKIFK